VALSLSILQVELLDRAQYALYRARSSFCLPKVGLGQAAAILYADHSMPPFGGMGAAQVAADLSFDALDLGRDVTFVVIV
jgi:hypothetical protein